MKGKYDDVRRACTVLHSQNSLIKGVDVVLVSLFGQPTVRSISLDWTKMIVRSLRWVNFSLADQKEMRN